MNKLTPIVISLLIVSTAYIWYSHNQCPVPHRTPAIETIIVGTNSEYPPFSFIKNDQIIGFDIDLVKEVVNRLDKKIEIKDMPFTALIPETQLGQIHVIATGLSPTALRAKRLLFTKPYLTGGPLLIISRADAPLKTILELTNKDVIVNEGFTADFFMSDIQGPHLVKLKAPAEAFLALQNKRADAFVSSQASVTPFFDKYGKEQFSITVIPKTEEIVALAISKKFPKLLEQIEKVLEELKEDGTIEQLKQKWNL